MFDPPPALFSTMNGCPSISASFTAMRRATMSFGPPGAYGTTILTGLDGYLSAACTAGWAKAATQAAAMARERKVKFMACLQDVFEENGGVRSCTKGLRDRAGAA